MIIRNIKTKKTHNTGYLKQQYEYWMLNGSEWIRRLKPAEFRCLPCDKEKEYTVEKDDDIK